MPTTDTTFPEICPCHSDQFRVRQMKKIGEEKHNHYHHQLILSVQYISHKRKHIFKVLL